jgi:hypothetical protein
MPIWQRVGLICQHNSGCLNRKLVKINKINMVAQAMYASVQDNAASLMQPLHEASQVLARNIRHAKNGSSNLNSAEKLRIATSFKKAMDGLEKAESNALYYNSEQLQERLQSLNLVMIMASTVKNMGEPLVAKARAQRPAYAKAPSRIEEIHSMFVKFHKKLREVIELVDHLANTPDPDEDSDEFAEFLVSLSRNAS